MQHIGGFKLIPGSGLALKGQFGIIPGSGLALKDKFEIISGSGLALKDKFEIIPGSGLAHKVSFKLTRLFKCNTLNRKVLFSHRKLSISRLKYALSSVEILFLRFKSPS